MLRIADVYVAPVSHAEPFLPPYASIVETQEGYDVVDKTALIRRGEPLLIWFAVVSNMRAGRGMRSSLMMARPLKARH